MVESFRSLHQDFSNCHFIISKSELSLADYLMASTIFNVKLKTSHWTAPPPFATLSKNHADDMNRLCCKSFFPIGYMET